MSRAVCCVVINSMCDICIARISDVNPNDQTDPTTAFEKIRHFDTFLNRFTFLSTYPFEEILGSKIIYMSRTLHLSQQQSIPLVNEHINSE